MLLKIPQQTKTCSKSTTKKAIAMLQECDSGVFIISLGKFLIYVTEPCFRKSSGLSINGREGVCDAV